MSVLSFLVISILFCCKNETQNKSPHGLNLNQFKKSTYNEKVRNFLKSKIDEVEYKAFFIHTKGCSECIKNNFQELIPYLNHTKESIYLLLNDSINNCKTIINSNVKVKIYKNDTFEKYGILHNNIYLYVVKGNNIKSIELNGLNIDSLNNTIFHQKE